MCKLILDCCCNHLGDELIIKEMIKGAANHKVDYVKFQLYDSSVMSTTDSSKDFLEQCEITEDLFYKINSFTNKYNIKAMYTIFNESRLEWVKDMNVSLKISSSDASDLTFVHRILNQGKETFISTGMSSKNEIKSLRYVFKEFDNAKWLYCVSRYPTYIEDIDFEYMKEFDGFSDHSIGITAIEKAKDNVKYIEKHFTLSRNLPIRDKDWSIQLDELPRLMNLLNENNKNKYYKKRFR